MAKVLLHGNCWREDIQKADPPTMIQCPEGENKFAVSKYDYFEQQLPAHCICGCVFMTDESDLLKEKV